MSCHFFLQGIFPTQGLNPRLLHCRQILYNQATWEAQTYSSNKKKFLIKKSLILEKKKKEQQQQQKLINMQARTTAQTGKPRLGSSAPGAGPGELRNPEGCLPPLHPMVPSGWEAEVVEK